MTAGEFPAADTVTADCAWMACHFSCYGTGLSNIPSSLPAGAMVIVNDRTPVAGHDPDCIVRQLQALAEELQPSCFLLDFQRPDSRETAAIADAVTAQLPYPVGVSQFYAGDLKCPVFLSPPPPDIPLKDWLKPWAGRELWLEAALDCTVLTVTAHGCTVETLPWESPGEDCFSDDTLLCHYRATVTDASVVFHLYRTESDLRRLLHTGESLGIRRAVGLYQQLGDFSPFYEETPDGA